ncbi:MAG TPA: FtsX-like permease family protein [Gammaproteobacteria bacterium]|nr:FtsX-like permease family protein [Gammaproteobacteria bacterium]
MSMLTQLWAVSLLNLRNLPARLDTALVALIGFAGVVAVLVGVLSIKAGFQATLAGSGQKDVAIVLRGGAATEINSVLLHDDVMAIGAAPGIAAGAQGPVLSPELLVLINRIKRGSSVEANVPFRGVTMDALKVHPRVHIVAGRLFRPGLNEVVVGQGAANEFQGLQLGSTFKSGRFTWHVVGIMAGGGIHESEIWTDLNALQQAYQRGNSVESVYVKLESPAAFGQFKAAVSSDPRLTVSVKREPEYYAEQSRVLTVLIGVAGSAIALLMGIGAIFGAINTMYTIVSDRGREIATLRALGFGRSAVLSSVLLEGTLLGLAGGALGGLVAYLAFNGFQASTVNQFSQVVFEFAVTPGLIGAGIVYALIMGFVGGLLPAIRAARTPVATAIRQL